MAGCVSKPKAELQALKAYEAGKREANQAQPKKEVYVMGNVINHTIPWTEETTLASALLAAGYQSKWDPHEIYVTRQAHSYFINVRNLLQGTDNPHLEPGDIVDIR